MTDVSRDLGVTLNVRRDVVMWHTVLCVARDRGVVAVAITDDPLAHPYHAQVVVHKTRSHPVAVQVARYVRRTFGVTEPVTTRRSARPVEAMIGYACAGGYQHPPETDAPWWPTILHVAETPVRDLLAEVRGGDSTARTRYVVYEARAGNVRLRGVTNRFEAIERRYREAPPDTLEGPVDLVQVGRHATREEADAQLSGFAPAGDGLWTRKPPVTYVRRVLALRDGDIVWTCDGSPAVRRYGFSAVVIGPNVYTEFQVHHALEHGEWPPHANSAEGRRLQYGAA